MIVTRKSLLSGIEHSLDLDVTEEALIAWKRDQLLVQDAFPHLSASQREFLISGITADEWDKEFAEPEDGDEGDEP